MDVLLKRSIYKSYIIGLPLGVLTILTVLILPVVLTGEGLLSMLIYLNYGWATIGLFVSFIFALGLAGKQAYINLLKGNSILATSFKYSLLVNFIIWAVFCLITLITSKEESLLMVIPGVIAFVFCTIITTFTIGLIISNSINKIIK